jgi:hypothetical protein
MNMMSKGEVLLTASDLLKWREEDKRLDEEIRQLQQRRSENKRRLDAAEVFADVLAIAPAPAPPPQEEEEAESDEHADSIPVLLVANLRETGASLNIKQIKQRLIDMGFGEKVKAHPNYHYATTYRLTKNGKLIRRGSKYRAAPLSSPEGEAEAVGASAHPSSHS